MGSQEHGALSSEEIEWWWMEIVSGPPPTRPSRFTRQVIERVVQACGCERWSAAGQALVVEGRSSPVAGGRPCFACLCYKVMNSWRIYQGEHFLWVV